MKGFKENQKELIKHKLILKLRQSFRSKKHNAFTEEVNKIALSGNDDKRIQSFNLIETYSHGTSKDICIKKKKENVTI